MSTDSLDAPKPRHLAEILNDHLSNTRQCGQQLAQLFSSLEVPETHIARIKQLEEKGDRLTEEAYRSLESVEHSELSYLAAQLVNRLDDIIDGINDTARLIDICVPRIMEVTAQDMLTTVIAMIESLMRELSKFPDNEAASVSACRERLKRYEESADTMYHEWRKLQRRINVLPLVDESNWTEIMGTLEQTTDAAYHAVLLLERVVKATGKA